MSKLPKKLDPEERDILRDFEAGVLRRIPGMTREKAALASAAETTLQKDKRINIRISSRDLHGIQMRAAREGMPYQTYIASVLHKVVSGRMAEVEAGESEG